MPSPSSTGRTQPRKRGRPPGSDAGYRTLAAQWRKRLDANEWPPGEPFPPLRALAKQYGAGYRQVWMAAGVLKKEGRLQATSGGRLLVADAAGGASALNPVLLVFACGNLRLAAKPGPIREIHRGILAGLGEAGVPVLTVHGEALARRFPAGFAEQRLSGILLMGLFGAGMLRQYERLSIPVVLLDYPHPAWKGHAVSVDNAGAIEDATQRLVALGHRRIAFLRFVSFQQRDVDADAKERTDGFLHALSKAGLRPNRNVVFNATPRDKAVGGGVHALLDARPPFTAVVASDPSRGQAILDAARQAGRRVPGDLSLVCLQNHPPARPKISGPRVPFEVLGYRATMLLGETRRPARHLRIPAVWHAGSTIAPPAT